MTWRRRCEATQREATRRSEQSPNSSNEVLELSLLLESNVRASMTFQCGENKRARESERACAGHLIKLEPFWSFYETRVECVLSLSLSLFGSQSCGSYWLMRQSKVVDWPATACVPVCACVCVCLFGFVCLFCGIHCTVGLVEKEFIIIIRSTHSHFMWSTYVTRLVQCQVDSLPQLF